VTASIASGVEVLGRETGGLNPYYRREGRSPHRRPSGIISASMRGVRCTSPRLHYSKRYAADDIPQLAPATILKPVVCTLAYRVYPIHFVRIRQLS
jgi:hypothetical protein